MQLGFSESWLVRLFKYIPSDLMDAIISCAIAAAIVMTQAQNEAELRNAGQEDTPWLRAGEDIDDDEMLLFEDATVGVMRHSFQPARGQEAIRRTETFVNRACCLMYGVHTEELLARVGGHELPESMCELDHLVMIAENMLAMDPGVTTFVQYFRCFNPGSALPALSLPPLLRQQQAPQKQQHSASSG